MILSAMSSAMVNLVFHYRGHAAFEAVLLLLSELLEVVVTSPSCARYRSIELLLTYS